MARNPGKLCFGIGGKVSSGTVVNYSAVYPLTDTLGEANLKVVDNRYIDTEIQNEPKVFFDPNDHKVIGILNRFCEPKEFSEKIRGIRGFIRKTPKGTFLYKGPLEKVNNYYDYKGDSTLYLPFIVLLSGKLFLNYPPFDSNGHKIIEGAIKLIPFDSNNFEDYMFPRSYNNEKLLKLIEKIKPWLTQFEYNSLVDTINPKS